MKDTLTIPLRFLFYKDGMKYCKIKSEDAFVERTVITGIDDGQYIEIISGLMEGEELSL